MLAIDTNVIVRVLTGDDPVQSPRARALIQNNEVSVSTSVVLETEWVLRDAFDVPRDVLLRQLRRFFGSENVRLDRPQAVNRALDWAEAGMGFADALHLACAAHCDEFATFDKALAKVAKKAGHLPLGTFDRRFGRIVGTQRL